MGLNFRKSISLGKLAKINLGKKSAGISFGVKGARYSVSTNGTRRATIGIPGTGLSYTKTFGTKKGKSEKEKAKETKVNTKKVEEFNESVEELIRIHCTGVDAIDWNRVETIPRKLSSLQEKVLAGDIDAYYEVIEKEEPFDELRLFGSEFEIGTDAPEYIAAEFNIKQEEIIPETEITLTKTGKVSEKEMSKSTYNLLLQDYACSVTLRLARDLFALLPVDKVIVHAVDDMVNTATGNKEELTLISVIFDRETFESLNLEGVDPSDCFSNFEHNMKFNKTQGFKPVIKLTNW
ncbi:MAG: DUF4236 domain-containing protein [Lachnospiraceae bacterium]|nr:DUF4236 domain-containing protein [Lachnospiraceae bacterium]